MGEWFAARMWNEHPALGDVENWAAPLALEVVFGAPTWGVARALPQAGMGRALARVNQRRGVVHADPFGKGQSDLDVCADFSSCASHLDIVSDRRACY